ncbi:MAG TPA: hypothetical protein VGZ29_17200 [Terriglobia bacterium]|nr:hypothetical protein [Terriglobia bacterium]
MVLFLPRRRRGVRVGQPDHGGVEPVAVLDELHVAVIGERTVLVEVAGMAHDGARLGASAAGDQIHDTVLIESFVVVDVTRDHNEARVVSSGRVSQKIGERFFVGASIMAGVAVLLKINHGWMVQVEEDEPDCRRQVSELGLQPGDLRTAAQQ